MLNIFSQRCVDRLDDFIRKHVFGSAELEFFCPFILERIIHSIEVYGKVV